MKETYERTEYAGVLSASEDAPALGEHPLFCVVEPSAECALRLRAVIVKNLTKYGKPG